MEVTNLIYSIITMAMSCFISVFLANLILELGLAKLASKPLAPLMRIANLPESLSIPAMISIVDVRGGLSVVNSLMKKVKIDDSTVIAYSLVTRPLSTVLLLSRHFLPVSIAALGFFVGSIYIALIFASALISMFIGIVYGRLKVKSVDFELSMPMASKNKGDAMKVSLRSAMNVTKKVVLRCTAITAAIAFIIYFGFFNAVSQGIDVYVRQLGVSPGFATLVSIHVISPISAVLATGELLRNGLIGIKECLIALLIGRLLFLAVMDYPRHSFPFYVSIFSTKLALKLVLTGILVNAVATPILIAFVALM